MKNKTLVVLILFVGCQKHEHKSRFDLYAENAHALITQIIAKSPDCNCIIEPAPEPLLKNVEKEMPRLPFREVLMEKFNLKNKRELDSLDRLSEKFNLKKENLNAEIKIIRRSQLKNIKKNSGMDYQKYSKALYNLCPIGLYYVSKPIFNKSYSKAAIEFNPAHSDVGPFISFCQRENGKWKVDRFY